LGQLSRCIGLTLEELTKKSLNNELRNKILQHFIKVFKLNFTLPYTTIYRMKDGKKFVGEVLLTLASMTSFSNLVCIPRLSYNDDKWHKERAFPFP